MKTCDENVDRVAGAPSVATATVEIPQLTERAAPNAPTVPAVEGELWGLATSIDIYNCDPDKIRDADAIRRFVAELCELIEMRAYGETIVVHFGEEERVAGYSMVQLIETSLISAHFANLTNAVYLDVFSCKLYDPATVADFAQAFFGGTHYLKRTTPRL